MATNAVPFPTAPWRRRRDGTYCRGHMGQPSRAAVVEALSVLVSKGGANASQLVDAVRDCVSGGVPVGVVQGHAEVSDAR